MRLLGKFDILEIAIACGLLACTLFMLACFIGVVQYIGSKGACR